MALKFNLAGGRPYNPFTLKNESEKSLRKEISRLRSVANKRISRMQAEGYSIRLPFRRLDKNESGQNLRGLLSDLYRFLIGPSTLKEVRAQRARSIKDFVDAGFDFVDDMNLDALVKYLEIVRSQIGYVVGSPIEIDYFERMYTGSEAAEDIAKGFYRWLNPQNKIPIK